MECDSTESSSVNISEAPTPKLPLTVYQPTDRRVSDWLGQSLSGGLPGDTHHSIVLDQIPRITPDSATSDLRQNYGREVDEGEEALLEIESRPRADSGSSLSFGLRQENLEAQPSLYRDIWSLRASLEQYASSDQSSTDRESIRSDAESVSSLGCAGTRPGQMDSRLSQDLDDEPEGEGEVMDGGIRGASAGAGEMGSGVDGEGEVGNRKLLQMDSGYASIETPSRGPEEMRIFGIPAAPRGKTASERRLFFTSSGRKGSVCESTDTRLFQEELEEDLTAL